MLIDSLTVEGWTVNLIRLEKEDNFSDAFVNQCDKIALNCKRGDNGLFCRMIRRYGILNAKAT